MQKPADHAEVGLRRVGIADVHYPPGRGADAALVVYADTRCADPVAEFVAHVDEAEPYRPGAFWRRELPPLRAVLRLAGLQLDGPLDLLILDGYVHLDGAGRPGLGARLHTGTGLPVIGIAKTPFRGADHAVAVLRGRSAKPLHVTAAGLSPADAAALVRVMAGPDRLPLAVRRVDRLARAGRVLHDRPGSA
jgi:deoxyribonuclease V